jgi:hypothetical protein
VLALALGGLAGWSSLILAGRLFIGATCCRRERYARRVNVVHRFLNRPFRPHNDADPERFGLGAIDVGEAAVGGEIPASQSVPAWVMTTGGERGGCGTCGCPR